MTYIDTPFVTLMPSQVEVYTPKALKKVQSDPNLSKVYQYFDGNKAQTKTFIDSLLGNSSVHTPRVGKVGYYKSVNRNWLKTSSAIIEKMERSLGEHFPNNAQVLMSPGENITYLMSYGNKYEREFSSLPTNTAALTSMSILGAHWRNQTLSNLHYTIQHLADNSPVLFATLVTTKKGQDILLEYAFDTHPPAYTSAGFAQLPLSDALNAAYVTSSELGSVSSLKQMGAVVTTWFKERREKGGQGYFCNVSQSYSKLRAGKRRADFFDRTFLPFSDQAPSKSAEYLRDLAHDSFPDTDIRDPHGIETFEHLANYAGEFVQTVATQAIQRTVKGVDINGLSRDVLKITWMTANLPFQAASLTQDVVHRAVKKAQNVKPLLLRTRTL